MRTWRDWQVAWQAALYGPEGFYRRPEGPAGHFRTASHAAPDELAAAIGRLATEQGCTGIVDVGAGRGELLCALAGRDGDLALHGVDLVERPVRLPARVGWSAGLHTLPDAVLSGALVIAWELLDTVPCPVLGRDRQGRWHRLEVDRTGRERLGPPASPPDLAWRARWWDDVPPDHPDDADAPQDAIDPDRPASTARIEVGTTRDALWAELVGRARTAGGAALLAVDYAHDQAARPVAGTLTGYRLGRQVPPVPDGSCDLTAHVALDAVAAAGEAAGATTVRRTDQRTALRELGITGRLRPGERLDAAALQRISREAELIDRYGLGGFGWLLQRVARSDDL